MKRYDIASQYTTLHYIRLAAGSQDIVQCLKILVRYISVYAISRRNDAIDHTVTIWHAKLYYSVLNYTIRYYYKR